MAQPRRRWQAAQIGGFQPVDAEVSMEDNHAENDGNRDDCRRRIKTIACCCWARSPPQTGP
jgi:hypothetical protein